VVTRSTIMDTNSFRADDAAAGVSEETLAMTRRRSGLLGPSYRLFYSNPVHLVRGEGAYVWDSDGEKYLDVYNNVVSVGHCHPVVVEAIGRQAATLNTHTRYLHDGILDYAEDLLGTLPAPIDQVMFMCTGSEANDLAIRVARAATGGNGIIVSAEAYHGTSDLTSAASPALGGGQVLGDYVRLVEAPDAYRAPTHEVVAWFAGRIQAQIDSLVASGQGFAGFLADSIFSSDGVLPGPRGYLAAAVDVVHRNGGVFISDEVQPGFGRTGEKFWGFERHGVVADIVTMGKPMGNGMPISALAAKAEVLAPFAENIPYFNTFGGNPVSIAAAQATLDVLRSENLMEHSRVVGARVLAELDALAARHESIGDVRGAGLFIGLELVQDRTTKTPDKALALAVVDALRAKHVLTSVAGAGGNVLKLRPPLAFAEGDIDWLVGALDAVLTELGA